MKKHLIHVGRCYRARVAGVLTTVRVDAIRHETGYNGTTATRYDVTNLTTGRRTVFRSAGRFRMEIGGQQ